ncbi:phosphotransferase enzyme family protein [Metarhizium robertsii ARSEF 23]|uniref:Phosphotransferase enzyme family protein n=1 Tax=Metarhizium robertsii (strain ARSEF 23 / ATCC MYA-3075) TaxID=655844 RepID=A0A0B2XHK2_METRA|nr:phosphotransferase enzyme family protein [Metarhizium robertsii ARSEF 23]KHO11022.1 phosphotransferase enzyme family protein [Metarhizium robertsii ARSEF 23]
MGLCASSPFEAMRSTSPPRTGRRPLKSYICRLPEELYDLETDPKEVHNPTGTMEYDSVVKQMREEVEKWQMETKDLVVAERWCFSAAIQGV